MDETTTKKTSVLMTLGNIVANAPGASLLLVGAGAVAVSVGIVINKLVTGREQSTAPQQQIPPAPENFEREDGICQFCHEYSTQVIKLPCGDSFHQLCIERSKRFQQIPLCPACSQPIPLLQ